ncbi:MAG: rhomboid family intramembrane serine protease [Planctomycetota bacterium]
MILPYGDDAVTRRKPYVNYVLLGANIAIFLGYGLSPETADWVFRRFAFVPGQWGWGNWYTVFTSMFLHGDFWHVGGNMLFLYIVGDNIEDKLGHFLYPAVYLACGLGAAALHLAADPASLRPTVGASGAISGVLAMYAIFFPRVPVKFVYFIFFGFVWYGTFRLSAIWAVGYWIVEQLLLGSISSMTASPVSNVAYWAHVGGFVMGFGMVLALRAAGVLTAKDYALWAWIRHPYAARSPSRAEPWTPSIARQVADSSGESLRSAVSQALDLGDTVGAVRIYQGLERSEPGAVLSSRDQSRLAEAAFRVGESETALEAYQRLLRTYPDHPARFDVAFNIAWLGARAGRTQQAKSLFSDLAVKHTDPAVRARARREADRLKVS